MVCSCLWGLLAQEHRQAASFIHQKPGDIIFPNVALFLCSLLLRLLTSVPLLHYHSAFFSAFPRRAAMGNLHRNMRQDQAPYGLCSGCDAQQAVAPGCRAAADCRAGQGILR